MARAPKDAAADGATSAAADLRERFGRVRARTEALAAPLSAEDMAAQSMTEASPVKWHLAHTTWFFERFFLPEAGDEGPDFDPSFHRLFNSYYQGAGPIHPRPKRGLLTRPSVERVLAYRKATDERVLAALDRPLSERARHVLEVGIAHEEQHQELVLTDVLHLLASHPEPQTYVPAKLPAADPARPLGWEVFDGGLVTVGAGPIGFAYDNERPEHRV